MTGTTDGPRATRWEIIGARLGVWTLPRGVPDPPPLSRRAILLAVAALAAAAAVVVAVVVPAIEDSKARSAAREQRAHAAFVRRERARLIAEQAPHDGRSAAAARLHATGRDDAARAALVSAVSAAVGRDARARVAAGALDGPIRSVTCGPRAGATPAAARVSLECLAVTSGLAGRTRSGHPFLAAGSLRDGRYAWCKENAAPGEGAAGTGVFVPPLRQCTR